MRFTIPFLFLLLVIPSCKRNALANDTPESTLIPDQIISNLPPSTTPFKNYLAVNAFEWDFVAPGRSDVIDEKRFSLIKSFSGIRHYLDWERIEPNEGKYTYTAWDYDMIYQRMKDDGLDVLIDIKDCPKWLVNTYPPNLRDNDNVPAPYGLDRSDPASYIKQAKAGFQLAARYGSNKNLDSSLVTVDKAIRWYSDKPNVVKIGLNLIKYIECDNERDKWWKGAKAQQSPEEYAANMSAFYDGHQGKLGKNVGVKTADPKMIVVMGGLANPDPNFVIRMIEWCKKNRGMKADGKVDLCFDVINYHLYSNDAFSNKGDATVGVAPELSDLKQVASKFVNMAKLNANNIPVWVTETGFDVNASTPQRAIPIGNKSSFITQADWNLRTALLYARSGIQRCMFYMLDDVDINSRIQYSSSGFLNADLTRRPSADYLFQAKTVLGNYFYNKTIASNPIVDLYTLDKKQIFVLTVPDQKGRVASYELDLGSAKQAIIYTFQVGKELMLAQTVSTTNGKLKVEVTETPIFVEKI